MTYPPQLTTSPAALTVVLCTCGILSLQSNGLGPSGTYAVSCRSPFDQVSRPTVRAFRRRGPPIFAVPPRALRCRQAVAVPDRSPDHHSRACEPRDDRRCRSDRGRDLVGNDEQLAAVVHLLRLDALRQHATRAAAARMVPTTTAHHRSRPRRPWSRRCSR